MPRDDDRQAGDWVERLASLAALFGFNRVRVRWRLERLRQAQVERRARAAQRVAQIKYEHKVCPACGRVNDRAEKRCDRCGAVLGARFWHVLRRVGLTVPAALSVSSILGLILVAAYARLVLAEGGPDAIFAVSVQTLYRFGGHWPPAVWAGEWWRLGTSIFLHLGLWHLGFNLFALSQIGPQVEEIFGRGRMLLFFLLTGVLANLGSELLGLQGVAIGASGAIMGLCGLAAGWGQRDGTSLGRQARNLMLKWGLYTLIFGFFIGADNGAHASGFLAGFVIGFAARPEHLRRSERLWLKVLQGALGGIGCLGLAALVFWPPASPMAAVFEGRYDPEQLAENPYRPLVEICDLYRQNRMEDALARWDHWYPDYGELGDAPPMDAASLGPMCASIETQRAQCRRFRKEGLGAVYTSDLLPQDELQRVELERAQRGLCDWLGE